METLDDRWRFGVTEEKAPPKGSTVKKASYVPWGEEIEKLQKNVEVLYASVITLDDLISMYVDSDYESRARTHRDGIMRDVDFDEMMDTDDSLNNACRSCASAIVDWIDENCDCEDEDDEEEEDD